MDQRHSLPTTDAEGKTKEADDTVTPTWECGRSLRLAGRAAEAVRVLQRGLADEPHDFRLHDELGMALVELDRHEEAIGSYLAALNVKPDADEICSKIASAFASRGMLKPAAVWYLHARQLNPAATNNLCAYGKILAANGCLQEAAQAFEQWIQAEPDNPVARHLYSAALGSSAITKASAEYVCALFDGYAPQFNVSLAKLKYCGPQLVLDALQQVSTAPAVGWDILDVGCGTGLVGSCLKPLARRLVGVDLSARMLDIARNRELYDELIESDMIDYLRRHSQRFDVLTAADVLTYVGDLGEFFHCATQALQPRGLVVVVVEALNGEGTFRLNFTGRFSHNPQYLRRVMENAGLQVTHLSEAAMRCEGNRPVPTLVAVGTKGTP